MKQCMKYLFLAVITASAGTYVFSHCEVPCGIYDDALRAKLIMEHISTIEKSMQQINTLAKEADKNYNQIVRWINNKEHHAGEIQHIASQYFITQRIKITDPADQAKYQKYLKELSLLHEIIVYAMKCKQTTDEANTAALTKALKAFNLSYFGKEDPTTHSH